MDVGRTLSRNRAPSAETPPEGTLCTAGGMSKVSDNEVNREECVDREHSRVLSNAVLTRLAGPDRGKE